MEWLVIFIVVVVAWYWFSPKKSRPPARQQQTNAVITPEIKITFTTSGSSRYTRDEKEPIDVGDIQNVGERAWILNPKSSLPLTLLEANESIAEKLKTLLGAAEYWSQKVPEIALLIAQHNLRFKEVDDFVREHNRRFDAEVQRQINQSAEWDNASDKDKEDLRGEFESKAMEALGISVGRADLTRLLKGEPVAFKEDDELLRQFAGDAALYSFYLSQLGRASTIVTVKADEYWRKSWERLVEGGFARRGKDIPVALLLEGLRLKDLNELLAGTIEKPLGRKAKAIEAALSLPDLQSRLSERISFREMFQAVVPNNLDVQNLAESFAYATALATVVQQTYYTALRTLGTITERKRDKSIYNAWEIRNWDEPMPACATKYCKKFDRLPAKLPPFHVGCDCQLQNAFRD